MSHVKLCVKFIELRLQKFRLEALPDTLTERDLFELESRRQDSPVVSFTELFSKLEGDEDSPKKVLIRARPGSGKTTLLENITREWAEEKIWPEIDYLFLITLRNLLETAGWSLSDLLFGDLEMSMDQKASALEEVCRPCDGADTNTILLIDGLDEYAAYSFCSNCQFPVEEKVNLSTMISGIICCSVLPEAKVLLTSRPCKQIPPFEKFQRVVDIYGFTREAIQQYVETFCAGKEELHKYIHSNVNSNPNLATLCHTPVMCHFVCTSLEDFFKCDDIIDVNTMTQLYTKASHQLGERLHRRLKTDKTDLDTREIVRVLKPSLLKHSALAKDGMTQPLKLIFDDDELKTHGFSEEDKQTGFLSGSKKTDPDDRHKYRNTWSFTHLTLQEFFGSYGLLQGQRTDILKRLDSEESIKQNEMVITFLLGLLGDARNAYFLKYTDSGKASVDVKEIIKKLAEKLKRDPKKLATFVFETQCEELAEYIPEKIKVNQIYPMEMLSLCWILRQITCRITNLR